MRVADRWQEKARDLAHRAGLSGVSPSVLAVCAVALVLLIGIAAWRFWPQHPAPASGGSVRLESVGQEASASPSGTSASREESVGVAWVHVVGAVRHPGVYEVPVGARVAQVMKDAGGLLGNAAAQGVNLARPVTDGEQIVVPTRSEFEKGGSGVGGVGGAASAGGTGAGGGPGAPGAPVDLNSADVTALDALPGVGPATAQKIVADREANGPYSSPEDLGRVPGIGPRKLEALKGLICAK